MRWALAAFLAGAWGASPSVGVQIFFTSSAGGMGLTDPTYAFLPTNGNLTDIDDGNWQVGTFPATMSNATVAVGETVYVWLGFQGEANYRHLIGLDLDVTGASAAAWYILDDTNGATHSTRWDGPYTPPHAPEYQVAHKIFIAVEADGLRNLPTDAPEKLWRGGAYRMALMGAVRYDTPGTYTATLGPLGIAFSPFGPPPWVEFGTVTVTPEPASLAALALVGFSIRRR